MTDLQKEIEEMTSQKSRLVYMAKDLERKWLNHYIDGYPKYFYPQQRLFERFGLRIVRQCGDKQVGKNTCLTSLYKEGTLIGTLEIFFDVDNNKLKIEISC